MTQLPGIMWNDNTFLHERMEEFCTPYLDVLVWCVCVTLMYILQVKLHT